MVMERYFCTKTFIFFITLALLLSAFNLNSSSALALSIDDEKEMGREFVSQIRRQFELLDGDFENQYFNDLGQYLLTQLETKPFRFHFYVIKDKSLNAFAAPGGHIFFFSGLINIMDSVDELASIMCHEIGHVSARHIAGRVERSKKIGIASLAGILAGVFIGGPAAGALVTGSMAAGIQAELNYSRDDERQADQLGFKYMKGATFDPNGLVSTLKKIERENWMGSDQIPTYLRTHPTSPERMSNLDSMLSYYTPTRPREDATRLRELFPFFQTVVRAKSLDPEQSEKLFLRQLEKEPGFILSHFGLGIVYIERHEYQRAINQLEKAVEKKPDFVPILTNLGEAYQMNGDYEESISVFEKAMKLDNENRSIPFFLGVSYENIEQYENAIRVFEKLVSFKPVKDEVYYHLGVSYGRLDRLALAHYNFGIYFRRVGRIKKAWFHFDKALEFVGDDTAMKEKIQRERNGLRKKYNKARQNEEKDFFPFMY